MGIALGGSIGAGGECSLAGDTAGEVSAAGEGGGSGAVAGCLGATAGCRATAAGVAAEVLVIKGEVGVGMSVAKCMGLRKAGGGVGFEGEVSGVDVRVE